MIDTDRKELTYQRSGAMEYRMTNCIIATEMTKTISELENDVIRRNKKLM